MTRKDYVLLAAVFAKNSGDKTKKVSQDKFTATEVNAAIARQLADVLANDNPRFDRDRFLKACGVINE